METLKRLHKWCNGHEWIMILILMVVLFRLPSLVTPNFYGDEEIYFVMGRAWKEGVPLYSAIFDHKPPLIYILAGLFPAVPTFRGMLLVMMILHTVLFSNLAKLFWKGRNQLFYYLSTFVFVVLSTIPTFEGLIVNAELLMMVPLTASIFMLWNKHQEWKWALGAGLMAGLGWLYKIPVAFDALAIALYFYIFSKNKFWDSVKSVVSLPLWSFGVGFVLPLAATFAYYYLKGDGADYLATVLSVNLGYVSSWSSGEWSFNPFRSGLVVRGTLLAAFTLILFLLRNKINKKLLFSSLWLSYALFGALLSFRPYPHYLQEVVPAFSLFVPTLFTLKKLGEWLIVAIIVVAGYLTQQKVGFWGYPTLSVYQNFYKYMNGEMTKTEYQNTFDNADRNYALAGFLNSRLLPKDEIFVWGSDPTVYNLTQRLPTGGKYIVSFHVKDLVKYDYVMQNLKKNKPKAIVIIPESAEFEELVNMIDKEYVEVFDYQLSKIYWRVGSN